MNASKMARTTLQKALGVTLLLALLASVHFAFLSQINGDMVTSAPFDQSTNRPSENTLQNYTKAREEGNAESKIRAANRGKLGCAFINPAIEGLEQDSPELIRIIKEDYLVPPSSEPYNLKKSKLSGEHGQVERVKKFTGQKTNGGFFIEAGADGMNRNEYLFFF